MTHSTYDDRRRWEGLHAEALYQHQLERLNLLLGAILPQNEFYAAKLAGRVDLDRVTHGEPALRSLDELAHFPFTFKEELQTPTFHHHLSANLTFALPRYCRFHQTSGTRGRPLAVLDTAEDWQWWLECWQYVLDAADVQTHDVCLTPFSFGPFIGFWTAYEAAARRGCLVVSGGGLSTLARLELLRACQATVLFCTPSYALYMAEVATAHQIEPSELGIRQLVVTGEPGGSIGHLRDQIARRWNARVLDHAGATEVGAWGYGDRHARGLHVLESEFIAEFLSVETGQPAAEGELAEIVLTSLGRIGSPLIRYRTGDLVRPIWQHDLANRFVLLDGGILGRSDDMLVIRGVNIFPSSLEHILRSFPEVVEYRMIVRRQGAMDYLRIEVEDRLESPQRIADELRLRLGLHIDVTLAPTGSLPRFEGKGKRLVDERSLTDE